MHRRETLLSCYLGNETHFLNASSNRNCVSYCPPISLLIHIVLYSDKALEFFPLFFEECIEIHGCKQSKTNNFPITFRYTVYVYVLQLQRVFKQKTMNIYRCSRQHGKKTHTKKKNQKKSLQINLEKQDKCRQELNFDIMNKW